MLVLAGVGCDTSSGKARDLAVSSGNEARAAVDDVLRSLQEARGPDGAPRLDEAMVARFCDQSPAGIAQMRTLLTPLSSGSPTVSRVEAAWVGEEPYFYVEVRGDDGYQHGFGVRVRTGCLDRAVGAGEATPRKTGAAAQLEIPVQPAPPPTPLLPLELDGDGPGAGCAIETPCAETTPPPAPSAPSET